jgi:hypothetical protein
MGVQKKKKNNPKNNQKKQRDQTCNDSLIFLIYSQILEFFSAPENRDAMPNPILVVI